MFVWVGVGWVRPKVPGQPHPPGMGTHMQGLSFAVMPLGTGLFGGGNAKDAQCREPALGGWAEPSGGEERVGKGILQAFPSQALDPLIQYLVWFCLFEVVSCSPG